MCIIKNENKMKKYFGKQEIFTLQQLIDIVNSNNQLGFYLPIEKYFEKITIHNWNNGNNGRASKTFILQENKLYKINN